MKIGKEKGKRKKRKELSVSWAPGEILAQCAASRANGPRRPMRRGDGTGGRRERGPTR
jgi:hypothetical protein